MNSQKTQGFFLLLVFVWLGTFFLNDSFASEYNSRNLLRYCSMFGIIGIGVMFVIVTGGIDLSIGSTIGLIGASLVLLLRLNPIDSLKPLLDDDKAKVVWFFWAIVIVMVLASVAWLVYSAMQSNFRFKKILFPLIFLAFSILSVIALRTANSELPNTTRIPWIFFLLLSISIHIGLLHGILITHFELQPFVVTLGGLLCYRGLIRWLTNDSTQGLSSTFDGSLQLVAKGEICTVSTLMMCVGFGAAIYFLVSLLWSRYSDDNTRQQNIIGMILGAIIGLIGSSRFWNGFKRINVTELFDVSILGIPLKLFTWDTIVSAEAAARPQFLMSYSWVLLIPVGILLVVATATSVLRSTPKSGIESRWTAKDGLLFPMYLFWLPERRQRNGILFLAITIFGLLISTFALRYAYLISSGEKTLDVSETQLWWIKMTSVFGSLALVMISVARMGRCVAKHGNTISKILFPICGLLAILSVLGRTEMSTTLVQMPFFFTICLAIIAIIIFDKTVFGRYLLAIGNNEDAARYSGINTQEVKVAAYVICSGIVGMSAIIFMLDFNSVAPTGFGSFYELYAIAAVVLGGCSLRGGEANIIGVLLGAAIMRVLANAPDMIDFPKTLELAILGLVILVGVIVDDRIRKQSAKKALEQNAA